MRVDMTPERRRWLDSLHEGAPVVLRHQDQFDELATIGALLHTFGEDVLNVETETEVVEFRRENGHPYMERSFRMILPVTPDFTARWQERLAILDDPARGAWLKTLDVRDMVIVHTPTERSVEMVGRCDDEMVRVSWKGKPIFYNFTRTSGAEEPGPAHVWISPATPEAIAEITQEQQHLLILAQVKDKFAARADQLTTAQLRQIDAAIEGREQS